MTLPRPPIWFAVLASAATLVTTGCGGTDCAELCEQASGCEGNDQLSGDDCEAQCAEAEDLADEADCGGDFDDYLDCIGDADDVCSLEGSGCEAEAFTYAFCVLDYCQDHPNEPGCASSGGGCSSYRAGGEPDCTVGEQCGEAGTDNELRCDGESCICSADGNEVATVPYDAAFCTGDLDGSVGAASSACGW